MPSSWEVSVDGLCGGTNLGQKDISEKCLNNLGQEYFLKCVHFIYYFCKSILRDQAEMWQNFVHLDFNYNVNYYF